MKLFPKIRLKLGQRSLRKRAAQRIRKKFVQNFSTAETAGILMDASYPDSFHQVKEFRDYLSSLNIKTTIIGYVNSEEIPGELILWENCTFFGNLDLDYFFRPKNPEILEFINHKYDILFDLSFESHFPISYISTLSSAGFKVARYSESLNDHDLMINTGNNTSIEYLIEQIIHYVGLLNKPPETTVKQK